MKPRMRECLERMGGFHNETTAWVVLAISLIITVLASYITGQTIQYRAEDRFAFEVEEARHHITGRMLEYEQVLWGGVGLFKTLSGAVTRKQWHQYIETLQLQCFYPGIQGMGFALMLGHDDLASHIEEVRSEGFPDYSITPVTDRNTYSTIVYLEPFDARNRRAFGYDMFSEEVRRTAMERARDSGRPAVSGRVTLVQEKGDDVQAGFLMYLPVYKSGLPTRTVEERQAALLGFVYSPFRVEDLMEGILGSSTPELGFDLFDGGRLDDSELLYSSDPENHREDGQAHPAHQTTTTIELPGRTWTAHFHSRPAFDAFVGSSRPLLIAVGGVMMDFLLFIVIWSLASQRKRVQRKAEAMTASVRERTHELEMANRELEIANSELETFSYSVSHDLRGPLRAIDGFTQMLREDYGERLDATGLDYIASVNHATIRLGAMSDGLLKLSRLSRSELRSAEVDLSSLAEDIVRQLRAAEPNRAVNVKIAPGLKAIGDPALLDVALQNVIGNAWKFTAQQPDAHITVGQITKGGREVFFVRDNGAGFEAQYAQNLFEPFKRLHTHNKFQGTGIGLATVRRIIQRHEGEVWAEGATGEGASIYFTLRKAAS